MTVRYEVDGHVALLTLDRVEKRNAMNQEMRTGLLAAIGMARADAQVRVLVLTGAGDHFCSGHDLDEAAGAGWTGPDVTDVYTALMDLNKPVVAALEGACVGQGAGLALLADIRIAGEKATFWWPQVRRGLGSVSGPAILARLVPSSFASLYLFTGEPVPLEEAARHDLVTRTVAAGNALQEARAVAGQIARNAPLAVQAIKTAMQIAQNTSRLEAMRGALAVCGSLEHSRDAAEGIAAFKQRRAPAWEGR